MKKLQEIIGDHLVLNVQALQYFELLSFQNELMDLNTFPYSARVTGDHPGYMPQWK